jgi:murein DD-endopeptidase MepM/ murein hydrolase activator NlpD
VDIGVPIGTPVYAAADGTVFHVDNNDRGTSRWRKYQYGKYIMIDHDDNLTTLYGHLSRQVVTAGEKVTKGELIGYSGETGYADGPHVHFGLYWTPSIQLKTIYPAAGLVPVGVTIDPMAYLPQGVATIQRGAY